VKDIVYSLQVEFIMYLIRDPVNSNDNRYQCVSILNVGRTVSVCVEISVFQRTPAERRSVNGHVITSVSPGFEF
jgi:hypothetical protein